MSFSKSKRNAIENYILEKIAISEPDVITKTKEAFSLSINSVYRYLNNLIDKGNIERKRNGVYSIVNKVHRFKLLREKKELDDEQKIYDRYIYPELISGLPENVRMIWDFSFTEMMNNVIDHSFCTEATCVALSNLSYTAITIYDNGVGIFKSIKDWFGLDSIEDAIAELFKGRVTTDSANHSGEGIFFTSRLLDEFAVLSSGKVFTHNRFDEIFADFKEFPGFERWQNLKGTIVFMKQSNISTKIVSEILERFSDEDTAEFSKTSIPIKEFFDTYPVSRSQAKRLCARLNVFKEIELDFEGVSDIGQGFADEVFRVFQDRNPEIIIKAINMTPNVERMFKHVTFRK